MHRLTLQALLLLEDLVVVVVWGTVVPGEQRLRLPLLLLLLLVRMQHQQASGALSLHGCADAQAVDVEVEIEEEMTIVHCFSCLLHPLQQSEGLAQALGQQSYRPLVELELELGLEQVQL